MTKLTLEALGLILDLVPSTTRKKKLDLHLFNICEVTLQL